MKPIELWHGDFFQESNRIPHASVNLCVLDLPYGVTHNFYDKAMVCIQDLWSILKHSTTDTGTFVFTCVQPFTSHLVCSAPELFRYALVWEKTMSTGFLNSKCRPLSSHEDILVFSKSGCNPMSKAKMTYNPQSTQGKTWKRPLNGHGANYGSKRRTANNEAGFRHGTGGCPRSVLRIQNPNRGGQHPNQKPLQLMEWIILTFSHEGQLILDPTAGSMTTAIAAHNTGRRAICIEKDSGYYKAGVERVKAAMLAPRQEALL